MNINQKIIFPDTVFTQEVDGEMVLLDMETENYFGLDGVGTVIWQIMQEETRLDHVLEKMQEMYDVEEDVLQKDLLVFIASLERSGLITLEKR